MFQHTMKNNTHDFRKTNFIIKCIPKDDEICFSKIDENCDGSLFLDAPSRRSAYYSFHADEKNS